MDRFAICFLLLDRWSKNGHTGLTLPYLIGASMFVVGELSASADESDLAELLYALQDAPKIVRIDHCTKLKQPVAAFYNHTTMSVDELIKRKKGSSTLYISTIYAHSHNIQSVSKSLWALVGQAASEARFTFADGQYRQFDSRDLADLEQVQKPA